MFRQSSVESTFMLLAITVIITIIIGLSTSVFFLLVNKDSYSSIYIIPDSIIRDSHSNTVTYTYGVKSSESGITDYTLNIFLNNNLVKTKQFSLNNGEALDERDKITLPADLKYPSKIRLELSTRTAKEEVHFWLKE